METGINDIVLVYFEDTPLVFARVEAIEPDIKKDWYHVTLLLLKIPVETVTWILRYAYINGEPFTMGGKKMRIEKVVAPKPVRQSIDTGSNMEDDKSKDDSADKRVSPRVIPFSIAKKAKNEKNDETT